MTSAVSRSGSTVTKYVLMSLPSSPSLLQPAIELEKRRGADFRAVREAEEHRAGLAAEGSFGDRLAVLVGEAERCAIGRARVARLVPLVGDDAHHRSHQHDNAGNDQSHHEVT
jgi:hypothetical protein